MKQSATIKSKQNGLSREPMNSLPKNWEWKYLHELGSFSKGKGILKEQVIESGLPCIRYGEIYTTHNFILKEFKSFISEDVAMESKEIKSGDILFAGSGETLEEIGKAVAFVGNEKAYAGGDVIILSTNENVNTEWLSYVLETGIVRRQKRRLGQGHSVVHIYPSDLATLKVPYPPEHEQESISSMLVLMDISIAQINSLIEKKELQKQWFRQMLLTGKKRLKGFSGEWKKIELELALDYEQPTKYLTNNFDSYSHSIPVLTANKTFILGYSDDTEGIYTEHPVIIFDDFTTASRYIDFNFKIKSSAIKLLTAKKGYNLRFIYERLQLIQTNIAEHKRRYISEFESKTIKVPCFKEQTAIAKIFENAETEIQTLKIKSEKVIEKKKGLMQVLLTGKIGFK